MHDVSNDEKNFNLKGNSHVHNVAENLNLWKIMQVLFYYSTVINSTVIGSWITESAAYCNQILVIPLYLNSTQKTLVNLIRESK